MGISTSKESLSLPQSWFGLEILESSDIASISSKISSMSGLYITRSVTEKLRRIADAHFLLARSRGILKKGVNFVVVDNATIDPTNHKISINLIVYGTDEGKEKDVRRKEIITIEQVFEPREVVPTKVATTLDSTTPIQERK